MQDRLSKLVTIFDDLDFRGSRAEGDDLLGDAYEYLMRHFATESGKSKGQFYTPAEVSRILAKVVGIGTDTRQDQTVYDPTCGSGSLLLKAADEAPRGMTIYGQEKDNATWALSKMNMILHGNEIADIAQGRHDHQPAVHQRAPAADLRLRRREPAVLDEVVEQRPRERLRPLRVRPAAGEERRLRLPAARPQVAQEHRQGGGHPAARRAVPRQRRGDDPHGSCSSAATSRASSACPPNLFYGTGIPACIVVLDKENAQARTGVFMIDASKGFMKDGPKNRLRSQDIHKIVDVFNKQTEIERYSRMVPLSEIADPKNDYNLNIPRYIDSSEPEDIQDLHAHLHGGIPDRDIDALERLLGRLPAAAQPALQAEPSRLQRPGDRRRRGAAGHARLDRVPEVRRRGRAT